MHMRCTTCGSCECTCYDTDFEYLRLWAWDMARSLKEQKVWVGYLAPRYRAGRLARAWDCYLQIYCTWTKKDFEPDYCWNAVVPPLRQWAEEVRKLNEQLAKKEKQSGTRESSQPE